MDRAEGRGLSRAQTRTAWLLWATYGAFYFCRTNIAASVPGLKADLHLSPAQVGTILGGLKLSYAIGQFVNGQLSERVPARVLLALGMFTSAALNVVFGFGTGVYFLLFVWAANGFFQSMGWSPTMKVASRWFPPIQRGRAVGLIGTGYQLTGAVTFVVAGWSASRFGWRGAHLVPAAMLALMGVVTLVLLREEPPAGAAREEAGSSPSRSLSSSRVSAGATPAGTWRRTLLVTLLNPRLWLLGLSLGLVNACRYGFLDWGITHLKEVQGGGVGVNALKYAVLPLGGMAGAWFTGWATDRLFGGRRVPVVVALLVGLGASALAYDALVRTSPVAAVALLAVIGFCVFGPQVILVGTAAMDVAVDGRTAAAVGFVDLLGYLGAFSGDQVTGLLTGSYSWHAAVSFWATCAFAAALVVAPLWRFSAARASG